MLMESGGWNANFTRKEMRSEGVEGDGHKRGV
jgi:hypothetical protein